MDLFVLVLFLFEGVIDLVSSIPEGTTAAAQDGALAQIDANQRDRIFQQLLEAAQVDSSALDGIFGHDDFGIAPSDELTAA